LLIKGETQLATLINDFVSISLITPHVSPVKEDTCCVTVLDTRDDDLMFLLGAVNGIPFTFTVDTGCGGVVMNKKFIKDLRIQPRPSRMRLEFADSSLSETVLQDTVTLTLTDGLGKRKSIETKVYFADIPAHEVIIGLPWMRKHVKYLCPAEEGVSHD